MKRREGRSIAIFLMARLFLTIGSWCTTFAYKIYPHPNQKYRDEWRKAKGDQTLRLNHDLNESSFVLDVGGYQGQWVSDIYAKYRCKIYAFEPIQEFADLISERFKLNPDVTVFPYGLMDQNSTLEISVDGNASSLFRKIGETRKVRIVDIEEFFREYSILNVDLMQINIEGAEYPLLEHVLDSGLIKRIRNLQIQFHRHSPGSRNIPDAEQRMKNIQHRLGQTHHLTYQYLFNWENWKINP